MENNEKEKPELSTEISKVWRKIKKRIKKVIEIVILWIYRTAPAVWKWIKNLKPIKRMISYEHAMAYSDDANNQEYAGLSYRFAVLRNLSVVSIVVLLICILFFGRNIVSYENFYYMLKDIGSMSSFAENNATSLNYSAPDSNQDFSIFKNGLAVAGDNELKLFTLTGRITLTEGVRFNNPVVESSDKFIIVYDRGGYKYSIYNSFVNLKSEQLDYPIYYVSVSTSGRFVIVTGSGEYRSSVLVYDDDYELIRICNKNDYVISADIDESGKFVVMTALVSNGGSYSTKVSVYNISTNRTRCEFTVNGTIPYEAKFISDNRFALFCRDRVIIYNTYGWKKHQYNYTESNLAQISIDGNGFAMMFESGELDGETRLVVFNRNGFVLKNTIKKGYYNSMEKCGNYIFLLGDGGLEKFFYPLELSTYYQCDGVGGKVLVCNRNKVIICHDTYASYIKTGN